MSRLCGECNGVIPCRNADGKERFVCAYLPVSRERRTEGGTKITIRTGNRELSTYRGLPVKHAMCRYKEDNNGGR